MLFIRNKMMFKRFLNIKGYLANKYAYLRAFIKNFTTCLLRFKN